MAFIVHFWVKIQNISIMIKQRFNCSLFILISIIVFANCKKEPVEPISTLAADILKNGGGLQVGASVVNINPSNTVGVSLEGYHPRNSDGLHDDLTARCLVVAKDSAPVVLISLDLVGIHRYQTEQIKAHIRKATGVKEEEVFVHATHTHSAPSMMDGKADGGYLSLLYKKTAEAAVQAFNSLENVNATFKTGVSSVATVNRRNPERQVENTFNTLEFTDTNGDNIASILNFGCHPVVLGHNNNTITADFVHYLREAIENETGGTSLFFNGSFGIINPARNDDGDPYDRSSGTFAMAKSFGEQLAYDMLNNYTYSKTSEIEIKYKTKKIEKDGQYTFVSVLDLGIVQIAMTPGEPLDSYSEEVLSMLPGSNKMIFGLMDEHIGYIVPDNEWGNCTNSFKPECYEETMSQGTDVANLLKNGFAELCNEMFGK